MLNIISFFRQNILTFIEFEFCSSHIYVAVFVLPYISKKNKEGGGGKYDWKN